LTLHLEEAVLGALEFVEIFRIMVEHVYHWYQKLGPYAPFVDREDTAFHLLRGRGGEEDNI
jgi:hypothetical protein